MMGNFRDDYAARGVHDPLWAHAIVFADDRGGKAGLLAVDACMLDRENVAEVRSAIAAGCDVPPQNVLVHATHTHSGPATSGMLGMAAQVAPHSGPIQTFLHQAASAVVQANGRLEEAALRAGHVTESRVSFNRRLRRADGTTQMNWEALQPGFDPQQVVGPWGPIDPEMICLAISRPAAPPAALVHFGLHPAILAGDNWLYSADYPGYLRNTLAQTLGEGAPCVFLNGCCGNVNHVDFRDPNQRRGYEMAQRVGSVLAATARQAIDGAEPFSADRVEARCQQVLLERLKISPAERARCQQVLNDARQHPPAGQVDGLPDAYFAGLRLEMARVENEPDPVEVMAIRIGDAALVGLPGEAFCQLGMAIKRRSPARHTLVAGLCNDAIGYLPIRAAFDQGGYEPTAGSTFYVPGSAEQLVEAAVSLLEQLFAA